MRGGRKIWDVVGTGFNRNLATGCYLDSALPVSADQSTLTIASWMRVWISNAGAYAVTVGIDSSTQHFFQVGWSHDYTRYAGTQAATTSGIIFTGPIPLRGILAHVAYVKRSASNRSLYLNGRYIGDSTGSVLPDPSTHIILCNRTSTYASSAAAEFWAPAGWGAALTNSEIQRLATGTHPLDVATQSLKFCVEAPGICNHDVVSGREWTAMSGNAACRSVPFPYRPVRRRLWVVPGAMAQAPQDPATRRYLSNLIR